ncbi:CRISPR-associated helicase Cas3' [Acidomonas methanolica]|nr:CRISPR-associated helicase Cas3' [Acidomonas methanolica]TCS21568.1 CRISPR-associated Cas3 family helicase [Acidomonas methanolica]
MSDTADSMNHCTYTDAGGCWAKLRRTCREQRGSACRNTCDCEVTGVLSLVGHSADVAAVLSALLEQSVIAARLARLLGKASLSAEDRARICTLAALHDLGKISQGFQHAPFDRKYPQRGHIMPLVSLLKNGRDERDRKSAIQLRRLVTEGGLGSLSALLGAGDQWEPFLATLAHHGDLPAPQPALALLWQATATHDPIAASRGLIEAIRLWFPAAFDGAGIDWTPRFGHAFAGLLTLADWLGSDTTIFPMAGDGGAPDGTERYVWAKEKASELLARRLLAPETGRAACASFTWEIEPLTGFAAASAAQAAVLALPSAPAEGRTCLIEDETGSGKTEAALIHFLRLFDEGAVDGLYFALPTRAAAVQIHQRIVKLLKKLLRDAAPAVILAVPGYLDRASDAAAPLPGEAPLWPEEQEDAQWAAARPKRYLAACVAVGTIDQPLMGALRVRHAQLRSGAMLRLLLVVDEVHATDIYMTTILRHLLDQHRSAGGHALLMSATLGAFTRQSLLERRGRVSVADHQAAIETPYPAVWTDNAGFFANFAKPPEHEPKSVRVTLNTVWDDPATVATFAAEAGRMGARVLVIRNTVGDVVATQLALEALEPGLSLAVHGRGGPVLAPHHARFAPEDRRLLDGALEAVLGAHCERRGGSVTITSQTAEQSLDIDADLLITDLCPADVLLQRIGRLHRKRDRVPIAGFEEARVILLAPTEDVFAACFNADGQMGRGQAPLALGLVYPDLLGVVATRRAIAASPDLVIPRDNRRLVEAASHPESLQSLAEELGGAWVKHWWHILGTNAAQEGQAGIACLEWDKEIAAAIDLGEHIRVRLGLDDRLVSLPPATIGPFGHEISSLTVPGRWLSGVSAKEEPVSTPDEAGGLSIRFGDRLFVYDRLGLRRA